MSLELPKRRGRPRKSYDGLESRADVFFRRFSEMPFSDRELYVTDGVSLQFLLDLIKLLRIEIVQMEQFLFVDAGTLTSKGMEDIFSPIISDRILSLLELYNFGIEALGGFELFNEWMKKPSESFIFHRPIDIIMTHSGLLEVRRVLMEVKSGHY